MSIYTRAGDSGKTKLGTGSPVPKSDPRVEAYGTVDELSSFVGLAVSTVQDEDLSQDLVWVQEKLFTVGAILAFPGRSDSGLGEVTAADVERLERGIDAMSAELPGLEGFILPGGTQQAALLHCARSISRRAERMVSRLNQEDYPAGKAILPFLNRLSDYLFCAARLVNHRQGNGDVLAGGTKK
ncbi:MAG TPA: cob(I)yrinic acid a,c-diamide adenosyltransferase [Firmicutes bacterium]|jgi:cob(I)alamin adenosyltransferase|nr:cob(I)yrinic acid a,c-diamide adenosyltransferase [Bacillota bacterium]HHT43451.1 cob(I)yrinic acid a,c-diamide adenosyltransferase [Bacillota bacterium]